MNCDEGSYQLSHVYDRFLNTVSSRCVKNWKNGVPASSDGMVGILEFNVPLDTV